MTTLKFPRTPHLPGSKGTDDDIMLDSFFLDGEVVSTEKMDGSNITLAHDAFYTRSGNTPNLDWTVPARKVWEQVFWQLPESMMISGELLTWRKSIAYENLPAEFIVFSVIEDGVVLSWDDTVDIASSLGLVTVPVISRGDFGTVLEESMSKMHEGMEGFVIRPCDEFLFAEYSDTVAKFVGAHHSPVAGNNGKNTFS